MKNNINYEEELKRAEKLKNRADILSGISVISAPIALFVVGFLPVPITEVLVSFTILCGACGSLAIIYKDKYTLITKEVEKMKKSDEELNSKVLENSNEYVNQISIEDLEKEINKAKSWNDNEIVKNWDDALNSEIALIYPNQISFDDVKVLKKKYN